MERRKDAPDTLDLLKNTGQWMKENPLDALAIGTAPIPVAGDVIGVANDLRHLAQNPSWGNLGWTALGALPFVPSGIGANVFRRKTKQPSQMTPAELRAEATAQRFGDTVDTSYRVQHQPKGPLDDDPIRLDDLTKSTTGNKAG